MNRKQYIKIFVSYFVFMLNNFCLLCIILEKIILLIWSGCHKSSPLDPKMNHLNPVQSCSLKNYINICFSFKSWSHTFRFSCKKFVCISHLIRNLVLKSESQNIIHLHYGDNSNSSSNDGNDNQEDVYIFQITPIIFTKQVFWFRIYFIKCIWHSTDRMQEVLIRSVLL